MAGLSLSRVFVLRGDDGAQALYAFLRGNWRQLADAGKPLAITVSEHRAKRSTDQNKRLHALLTHIADSAYLCGRKYEMEAWKEFYRRRFIGTEEIEMPDGTTIERGISTTSLSIEDFSHFLTAIEAHAATELGVQCDA
ncbi:recombination protein NinB [Cupriavidus gilardii]|uniref:recombination protein NinB n=1 Tax=Cupriavidus gilardii TaxID=82541 RepID=UPI002B316C66|nr:recombination protein NinB [Cupriavidus gilardii]